jgi:hypothetical protein
MGVAGKRGIRAKTAQKRIRRIRLLAAAWLTCSGALAAEELPDFVTRIDAGKIVTVADGDFVAASYADGRLAPVERGFKDRLSVVSWDTGYPQRADLEVSNSVTAPPEVLAVSEDGDTAFVIERLGQRLPGQQEVSELPAGRWLSIIDLSTGGSPRLIARIALEQSPEALALHPQARWLAVVSNADGQATLHLLPLRGRQPGQVQSFPLTGNYGPGDAAGAATASNVAWHPMGDALAVNFNTRNRIRFLRMRTDVQGRAELYPWGAPVEVGVDPFVGRFTPDGNHYLSADWGRDFAATSLEGRLPQQRSRLSVVRLESPTALLTTAPLAEAAQARHRRIGGAETDLSSEGLAVSPDGTLVATVNMRGTALPSSSPRFQREASVSLFRFDAVTGALEKQGDYRFEGVLPEGGSFDRSGRHFLATVFEYHDGQPSGGGIEVFQIQPGARTTLQRLGRIPMPHGVHHVVVSD